MECYKCHRSNVLLVFLRAPGIWFICDDCIKEEEAKDSKVAVLSYSHGLMFVSQEEAARLTGESAGNAQVSQSSAGGRII
jgi:hypothetical protein